MKLSKIAFSFFLLLIPSLIFGQNFGKNKVQYKDFTWYYIQSKHFDIYFYDENKYLAEFVADIAESSYVALNNSLKHDLQMRVPIIVYNSHNDFQQNNVIPIYMEEGIGGVTELFKNRVVLPYEGDYSNFRHTLHHELLHAIIYDYIYGGSAASIISGRVRLQLPLWYHEGLAEYESEGWSTNADMIIRDGIINGIINNVTPYKVGQSIHNYIAEKYGHQKIGEILSKIKITHDVNKGFKASIGIGIEKLVDDWQRYLKRRYWPEIENRKIPEEIAKQLTNHIKMENRYNISPALSPNGDKIAFISDKEGYFSIFLISTIDGKIIDRVIKGQRTAIFEELHILNPGISWSPDGNKIAFAAKGGKKDYLYMVDIYTEEIDKKEFDLDGLFDATWSPDGEKIAFMGTKNGASDIFIYYIKEDKLVQLTDDYFSDSQPAWSPDSKKLLFVSDRKGHTEKDTSTVKMQNHDFNNKDIYTINADGTRIKRLTVHFTDQKNPVWSPDGKIIAYTSDQNGIHNIYFHDVERDTSYAVTDIITGISHLCWSSDGNKLAFSALFKGGTDIFMIKNPYKLKDEPIKLSDTKYMAKLKEQRSKEKTEEVVVEQETQAERRYANYIFDKNLRHLNRKEKESESPKHILEKSEYKTTGGEYKIHKYRLKFSTDIVTGNAGVDTYYGLQGITAIQISDVLGDHKIQFISNLFYDLKNSDYFLTYYYLPKKIDYGLGIFNQAYHFYYPLIVNDPIYGSYLLYSQMRLRKFGFITYMLRPFSKYKRIEYILEGSQISKAFVDPNIDIPTERINALANRLIYTKDNVLWSMTGPVDGERYSIELSYSPKIGENGIEFTLGIFDYRRYFRFSNDFTFAFRTTAGASKGDLEQPFFLGGIANWFNRSYSGGIRVGLEDIFFSRFVMPLRGTSYYEKIGNRFALINAEFRFPMIKYLSWAWPINLSLYDVRGVLFYDIGSAWKDKNFRGVVGNRFKDLISGYGLGTRINLNNYIILKIDIAWKFDLVSSSDKPRYYFSLGTDF